MEKKIIDNLKKIKKNGKTIGLVHGVFDVVHVGHLLYFEEAKRQVDYLVASITSDKFVNKSPGKPIFTANERKKILLSNKYIDNVLISNDYTAVNVINLIKPNLYFKGQEYKNLKNDISGNLRKEIEALKKNKGKIFFTNTKAYSSSKIINEKFNYLAPKALEYIKSKNLEIIKAKFKVNIKTKKKILLIGDPILDIYTKVEPTGKSNKSSIISSRFIQNKIYPGGILLVANILSSFSNNVHFKYPSNKNNDDVIKENLSKKIKLIKIKSEAKIIKKIKFFDRYNFSKLFQLTHNETNVHSANEQKFITNFVKKNVKSFDKIIIFDYGYYSVFDDLIKIFNKYNKKCVINCQSNSFNFGFNLATKFNSASILCVDEIEFRLCVGDNKTNLKDLLIKNKKKFQNFTTLIVTSGKFGCHILEKNKIKFIPTIIDRSRDTIGCGDVFLTFFALCKMINNFESEDAALIAHIASGIHAHQDGNNNVLTYEKMLETINNLLK